MQFHQKRNSIYILKTIILCNFAKKYKIQQLEGETINIPSCFEVDENNLGAKHSDIYAFALSIARDIDTIVYKTENLCRLDDQ